jgi:2-polyprenyl-3-methyl-5-hydroxy-6-metoxy-1,4-benzoquinol methylase
VNEPDRYAAMWREVYGDMQDVGPTHRHMRRLLRSVLTGLDYESVLDVGCGAGHNLPLLTAGRRLQRVVGVDVADEPLRRARRRGDGEFRRLDVETASLDERFDLVFTSLLLEHLADDVAALRNLRAMAGRHLVATTIAGDFERYRAYDEQVGHVRNYRRGELEAKLRDAGFHVQRSVYWGFPL